MKRIILVAYAVVLLIACNNSRVGSKPAKLQRDTTRVVGVFAAADTNDVRFAIMKRVVVDSFMYFDLDTITKQKKWVKDTGYIITYYLPIDSALSKRNRNAPITDSLGRKILYPFDLYTDKKYVRSGWENVDSAISELKKIIK